MKSKVVKKAFVATIPVMAGYVVLGIGFGVLLSSKGYGILWSLAMSGLIYAGSMQFVAVDFLSGAASLIAVALTTLMVNARHLFYGISMIDKYKDTGAAKPYLIFALTDETYSLVCTDYDGDEKTRTRYYLLVSLFDQFYWVLGSVLGSLIGSLITFDVSGIDFALTALFLTVFTEQWLTMKDHVPAIIGVVASVLCRLIFGAGNFLIPAMLVITASLFVLKVVRDRRANCDKSGDYVEEEGKK